MTTLPPFPDLNNCPLVEGDKTMTATYARWFQSVYNILLQASNAAPDSATYIIQTNNALLQEAQVLANLPSGFVQVTQNSGKLTSTGDLKIRAQDLENTAVTSGAYTINGVNLFTVDAQGRLTAAFSPTITAIPSGSAGGDLSNSYPNPSVVKIQGVPISSTNATAVSNLTGVNTGDQTTVSGNAGSATLTNTTDDTTTNATMYPVWKTSTSGNLAEKVSSTKLTFNPSTGTLTTTTFSGALSGNATTSSNTTGNAATVTTNANLTGPITSVGNATSIASQTGTGSKFVVDTSPTLVTPNIGVATASSITFGVSTLNTYTEGTFTPTITCGSPGNLSVAYGNQSGTYVQIGKMVFIGCRVTFTPTFTTASGQLQVLGLPSTVTEVGGLGWGGSLIFTGISNSPTWPVGVTSIVPVVDDIGSHVPYCYFAGFSTATNSTSIQMSGLTTGSQYTICFSAVYHT